MARELTGTKVFLITASAFGVIIGVNVLMAVKAVTTFPGLEVANSYVASQTFDADRAAQQALGWRLDHTYQDGVLTLSFRDAQGQPVRVNDLSVLVGRTTEAADDQRPGFTFDRGAFRAAADLGPGRWMLLVEARAADGTPFRQRLGLFVKG